MARPTTKADLINASTISYDKLMKLINSMSEKQRVGIMVFDDEKKKEAHWQRDQNLRDVIVHLYEWHQLLLNWVNSNMNGDAQPFIPEPYNWRTYGTMNQELWEKHQATSLDEAMSLFEQSHQDIMMLVDRFDNGQLFSKDVYGWVGGSTLGSYFVSATSSHYEWALKKLRAYIKGLDK